MNSLPNLIAELPKPVPLAADGGVAFAPLLHRDSIDAWIDLMEAIEALCPRWPDRPWATGTDYRL